MKKLTKENQDKINFLTEQTTRTNNHLIHIRNTRFIKDIIDNDPSNQPPQKENHNPKLWTKTKSN